MKTQKIILSLSAALLIWNTGCEKKAATVQDQLKDAVGETGNALKNTAETVKETGSKLVGDVAAPASAKAQELIDSAKGLVGEGKFQDALAKLKDIGGEKLSLNQQNLVDALKAQIQKALGATPPIATDAAGAAGNLIKK